MPIKRELYPGNWNEISLRIRQVRAQSQCECTGECGLHDDCRCEEVNRTQAKHAKGKVVLNDAQLTQIQSVCRDEDLKVLCQSCHLSYVRCAHAE